MRGNVTFDPLARAIPAADPAILEILDFDNGEYVKTGTFIGGKRYDELIAERLTIRDCLATHPKFRCALCGIPVYLVANKLKHFFFRHTIEDGSCPAETRGELSQDEIRARKYHGLCESEPHRKIKRLIERSLRADPTFSKVESERQWWSSHNPRNRRQPDVQAVGPLARLAFEVQLSTTFLDVVVGRRTFYREEGALLIWIMGYFDPDYRRLTTDDLLFSNNSNIIVIDEETTNLSESTHKFHVHCHYRVPIRKGNQLVDRWESSVIRFENLTFELGGQRSWYSDYESQAAVIRAEIEREQLERRQVADDALRDRLITFWMKRHANVLAHKAFQDAWDAMQYEFQERGIALPNNPEGNSSFVALLNGILSARSGSPIGWKFRHLIEVAHRIAVAYPEHILAFGYAIRHFGREGLLRTQDKSGKWAHRATVIRHAFEKRKATILPDQMTLPLLVFLFPEIGAQINCFIERRGLAGN